MTVFLANETDVVVTLSGHGVNWDVELIEAAANVEREIREREFEAVETVLAYVEDDRLIPPSDPKARLDLARAIVALGWSFTVTPDGAETGCRE